MTTYTVEGTSIVVHDREEWQIPTRPVRGPRPMPDLINHFVVHWPGASVNWKPPKDVASHLRWANDMYLNDPNRGYSYGYGFVIGPNEIEWDFDLILSDIWEVRGFDIRIASNDGDNGFYGDFSNPNFNGRSISAQAMCSKAFPATGDQIEQLRLLKIIAEQKYNKHLIGIPHRVSDATTCPDDYIVSKMSYINSTAPPIVLPPPIPVPVGDDTVIRYSEFNNLLKSAPSVAAVRAGQADRWLNAVIMKVGSIGDVQLRYNLPVSGEYDQATGNAYVAELTKMAQINGDA